MKACEWRWREPSSVLNLWPINTDKDKAAFPWVSSTGRTLIYQTDRALYCLAPFFLLSLPCPHLLPLFYAYFSRYLLPLFTAALPHIHKHTQTHAHCKFTRCPLCMPVLSHTVLSGTCDCFTEGKWISPNLLSLPNIATYCSHAGFYFYYALVDYILSSDVKLVPANVILQWGKHKQMIYYHKDYFCWSGLVVELFSGVYLHSRHSLIITLPAACTRSCSSRQPRCCSSGPPGQYYKHLCAPKLTNIDL